jgi:2,3-bisphosphoglycerate-independent phosphoglycerate mutase
MRTHTSDPVPYVLYDSTKVEEENTVFSEKTAEATGIYWDEGYRLMDLLIK